MLSRRQLMASGGSLAVAVASAGLLPWRTLIGSASAEQGETFEIEKSEAEWRELLPPDRYRVLREEATEPAGSSPLDKEYRDGIFHCAGCDLPLYSSETKYESGTGWPSFWAALDDAVRTKEDNTFFMRRTEVHCRRCGGHLGHIFEDGPPPTGLRHCLNGLALQFRPAAA